MDFPVEAASMELAEKVASDPTITGVIILIIRNDAHKTVINIESIRAGVTCAEAVSVLDVEKHQVLKTITEG
jgi:hypothetical protein